MLSTTAPGGCPHSNSTQTFRMRKPDNSNRRFYQHIHLIRTRRKSKTKPNITFTTASIYRKTLNTPQNNRNMTALYTMQTPSGKIQRYTRALYNYPTPGSTKPRKKKDTHLGQRVSAPNQAQPGGRTAASPPSSTPPSVTPSAAGRGASGARWPSCRARRRSHGAPVRVRVAGRSRVFSNLIGGRFSWETGRARGGGGGGIGIRVVCFSSHENLFRVGTFCVRLAYYSPVHTGRGNACVP